MLLGPRTARVRHDHVEAFSHGIQKRRGLRHHRLGSIHMLRSGQQRRHLPLAGKLGQALGPDKHLVDAQGLFHAHELRHVAELQVEVEQQRAQAQPLGRMRRKQRDRAFARAPAAAHHRQQKALRRRVLRVRRRSRGASRSPQPRCGPIRGSGCGKGLRRRWGGKARLGVRRRIRSSRPDPRRRSHRHRRCRRTLKRPRKASRRHCDRSVRRSSRRRVAERRLLRRGRLSRRRATGPRADPRLQLDRPHGSLFALRVPLDEGLPGQRRIHARRGGPGPQRSRFLRRQHAYAPIGAIALQRRRKVDGRHIRAGDHPHLLHACRITQRRTCRFGGRERHEPLLRKQVLPVKTQQLRMPEAFLIGAQRHQRHGHPFSFRLL